MKIAEVAPLMESVPPRLYGGTERVVSYLADALVDQGHDVSLFASGDSKTKAGLIPVRREAIRLDRNCKDPVAWHMELVERVYERREEFDLIHFHCDYLHYPLFTRQTVPFATTMHGRMDLESLDLMLRRYPAVPLVSISDYQRKPQPDANWIGTVYHGLPANLLSFNGQPGDYVAFLGRISPEKRPDLAIEIAGRAGVKLKMAAKIDKADEAYYRDVIRPLMAQDHVEFIGEINEHEKQGFLGGARALLFPIDWPEPFGLVMIEAMACGTPVVAFPRGSVPEIIESGRNGFVVDDVEKAVSAVKNLDLISREQCRRVFDERFTAQRMAADYVRLFEECLVGFGRDDRPMEPQALR